MIEALGKLVDSVDPSIDGEHRHDSIVKTGSADISDIYAAIKVEALPTSRHEAF